MHPNQYVIPPTPPPTNNQRDTALIAAAGHAYGFLLGSRIGVIPASILAHAIRRNVDMDNPRAQQIVEAIDRHPEAVYVRTRMQTTVEEIPA